VPVELFCAVPLNVLRNAALRHNLAITGGSTGKQALIIPRRGSRAAKMLNLIWLNCGSNTSISLMNFKRTAVMQQILRRKLAMLQFHWSHRGQQGVHVRSTESKDSTNCNLFTECHLKIPYNRHRQQDHRQVEN
jgi:hypothetical protein